MHLFYSKDILTPLHTFSEEESRHIVRVLRLRTGDLIRITDGCGTMYHGRLANESPTHCTADITGTEHVQERGSGRLHIAIAPTKSPDRFEWFLEKATEIGIDEVTPLWCAHSERTVIKRTRLEKVMISAMKQSLKCRLPVLHEPSDFSSLVNQPFSGQKFIAWCGTGQEQVLTRIFQPGKETLILIGPEGDFSDEEMLMAGKQGFVPVSLGKSRLRTETAGVVACCIITMRNEE